MTPSSEFLAEQKRLTEAATGGVWEACDMNEGMCPPRPLWGVVNEAYYNPAADDDEEAGYVEVEIHVGDKADAEFIAAARSSVPRMIAALEAVMEIHSRGETSYHPAQGMVTTEEDRIEDGCQWCQDPWPCPTISAIEAALGASVA